MWSTLATRMFSLESPIIRFGPWVVVATLALVAIGTGLAADANPDPGRLGGDFPSFYTAGELVVDGHGQELYEAELQRAGQADLLEDGGFLYFAYPPYTAAFYAPLSLVPYGVAFGIHTTLALLALIASLVAVRPLVRGYLDGPARLGVATVVLLGAYPVIRSVLGGQNATFTLLGLSLVARFDREDRALGTGIAAAALLYKPQFGLLVMALLVLGRRWQAVGWAIVGSAALVSVGALVTGPGWVSTWLDAVSGFGDENVAVNGHLMISAWGWFENLLGSGAGVVFAGAVVVVVGTPMAWSLIRRDWSEIPWYAAAPLVVIAAPSALYYDATLVALTVITMVGLVGGVRWYVIAVIVVASWSQAGATALGWSPLFIPILVAAAGFALASVRGPVRDRTRWGIESTP